MLTRCAACLTILVALLSPVRAADRNVLSPSDLNSYADFYDGHEVTVKGYMILETHGHIIFDSRHIAEHQDDYKSRDDRYCLTIINPGFLMRVAHYDWGQKKEMILQGRFLAHYLDTVVDVGACGGNPGLTITKIIKSE